MPAEQRIIGGGLLFVGVLVAVLLIWLIPGGGSPKEAVAALQETIYPAYAKAAARGDYAEMKAQARAAVEAIEEGGATAVKKHLQGAATSGSRDDKALYALIREDVFAHNAEGEYLFDGSWYRDTVHRALNQLRQAIETDLREVRRLRETAQQARAALADARKGSGMPLLLPEAKSAPVDPAPIAEPNPVYENDRELYRVFGVAASELDAALRTDDPKGAATSARLRWNRDVAPGELGKTLSIVPERATALRALANGFEVAAGIVAKEEGGSAILERYVKQAAALLGAGLEEPHKAAFRENLAGFEKAASIVTLLRRQADLLQPYAGPVRALGASMSKTFKS